MIHHCACCNHGNMKGTTPPFSDSITKAVEQLSLLISLYNILFPINMRFMLKMVTPRINKATLEKSKPAIVTSISEKSYIEESSSVKCKEVS